MQNDKAVTHPTPVTEQDRHSTPAKGVELNEGQLARVQGGQGAANPRRPL